MTRAKKIEEILAEKRFSLHGNNYYIVITESGYENVLFNEQGIVMLSNIKLNQRFITGEIHYINKLIQIKIPYSNIQINGTN
jgi:hypothetical protein